MGEYTTMENSSQFKILKSMLQVEKYTLKEPNLIIAHLNTKEFQHGQAIKTSHIHNIPLFSRVISEVQTDIYNQQNHRFIPVSF